LDEDAILEVLYFAAKVARGNQLEDVETQAAAGRKDFERGDAYTPEELSRGAGRE
jgi:hypothetical protein